MIRFLLLILIFSLGVSAFAVEKKPLMGCEDRLQTISETDAIHELSEHSLIDIMDYVIHSSLSYVLADRINQVLIDHSASWDERLQAIRTTPNLVNSEGKLNFIFGPHLIDGLLGYNSHAQAKSEGKYSGDHPSYSKERTWAGGTPWTYYSDIQQLIYEHHTAKKVVDLGAGVGRIGMGLMAFAADDVEFIGYEFMPERVVSANAWAERFGLSYRFKMVHQDLSDPDFELPDADLFYMFQPFTITTEQIVVGKICDLALKQNKTITVRTSTMGGFSKLCEGKGVTIKAFNPQSNQRVWEFIPDIAHTR